MATKMNTVTINEIEYFLKMLSRWNEITNFLDEYEDVQAIKENKPGEYRVCRKTILESDVFIIALALMQVHYRFGNEKAYTLGELSTLFSSSSTKSASQKVKTIIDRIGNHFGLVECVYEDAHKPGLARYQIKASERLVKFFEKELFPIHNISASA